MKNREIVQSTVYRRYRAFFFLSLIFIILGLAADAVFFALKIFFRYQLPDFTWHIVFLIQAIVILAAIVYVISNRRIHVYQAQLAAVSPFFSEPIYLWPKEVFDQRVPHMIHHAKTGLVAALHIRGLENEVVAFYGQEELKRINTFIFKAIKKRFGDKPGYHYGFTMMNDFLLFSSGKEQGEFYKELDALTGEIYDSIAASGKAMKISLLFGGEFFRKGDKMPEISDRAIAASRFNETSRFSSEVALYSEEQQEAADSEKSMPAEIMEGINKEQFQIYYQPKFDLTQKKFLGAEALVRWNHPTRGLLPPSFFIPFSERSGLITALDHYIFERVMSDMEKWLAEGEYVPKVSINISRRTIYDPGVIDFLKESTIRHHVPPHKVEMELTESLAAKDSAYLYQLVNKVKELGMTTSIDDFGTGYSSLNSLKKLPFDVLKIDKSFIDDIEIDRKARDIVGAIIQISHSLNLYTVAEGVETEGQIQILKGMGLDSVQGFYYSKPRPNYEFRKFLKENPFDKEGLL